MKEIADLSDKQERAIVELLASPTVKEVSKKVRISEVTIYRWLKDETFKEYEKLKFIKHNLDEY